MKTLSEEHKQKIRESVLKWNREGGMPPEIRKRIADNQRGRKMTKEAKQKISQANKGNAAWNKGLTKETDERIRKNIENRTKTIKRMYREGELKPWNLGKKWSQEVKDKISLTRKGKTYEEIMGKEKAQEFKKKLSDIMKQRFLGKSNPMYGRSGELNPHFGKPAAHGKNTFRDDLSHFCHSKWEANYCRYLLWTNKRYKYEPKTFILALPDGKKTGYTPDFFVENEGWQELKGWENRSETKKWEIFQQQYPNEKFELISRDKYKNIEKLYKFIIPNWEI
ncbi:MAG: hypothetical protein KKE50_05180 [Nanoarchaeota archaeon]|nr:hypothetical protein [Nanoarchaeota archaeon]